MTNEETIGSTIDFVRQSCQGDSSGHDWWHIHRVRKNALAHMEGFLERFLREWDGADL